MTKKTFALILALLIVSLVAGALVGCTKKELTLTLWEPQDRATFTSSPVTIRGMVSDPKATVTVNNAPVWVDKQGNFSTSVEPFEGENAINVVATRGDKRVTRSVTIIYSPEKAFAIEINSPVDRAELTERPVAVSGKVTDPSAKVTVNGVEAEVTEDGAFSASVELIEGENTIQATATVEGKEPVTKSITVVYKVEQVLGVEIAAPQDNAELTESPVAVSSKVTDPSAKVTVNGVEVELAADGTFTTNVELTEGENTIQVTATIEGKNPVTKTITVTYKPSE
jgi:nitrogen fixation protein FixH